MLEIPGSERSERTTFMHNAEMAGVETHVNIIWALRDEEYAKKWGAPVSTGKWPYARVGEKKTASVVAMKKKG